MVSPYPPCDGLEAQPFGVELAPVEDLVMSRYCDSGTDPGLREVLHDSAAIVAVLFRQLISGHSRLVIGNHEPKLLASNPCE